MKTAEDRQRFYLTRILRNSSLLLGSNLLSSALSALALLMVARGLQPDNFGVFAMITAYVFVVDNLLNFQSWQAVVKFGSEKEAAADMAGLSSLLLLTVRLDIICAVLGALVASSASWIVGHYLNWDEGVMIAASLFSLMIATRVTSTAIGVLRMWGRFDVLALHQAVVGFLRAVFVVGVVVVGADMAHFLLAWAAAEVVGNVFLITAGWREVARRGISLRGRNTAAATTGSGLWSFLWTTNLHTSIKLAIKELDVLVLGFVAGAGAAGFYKVVKQVGALFVKAVGPLYQAVYPELAAAVAQHDRERFLITTLHPMRWAIGLSVLLFGLYALCGRPVIELVLGESYGGVFMPSLIYLAGSLLAAATFTLHPAALALGVPGSSLRVLMVSVVVYALMFVPLASVYGVSGAAGAFVVFYATWSVLMVGLVRSKFRSMEWTR